jgi:hypothetical protein
VTVATAKLFRNGRSQAVRLPKEFRFEGKEVAIRREGDSVVLEPLATKAWPRGYWRRWGKATRGLEALEPLPAGGAPVDIDGR